jgi:hypothetical protein
MAAFEPDERGRRSLPPEAGAATTVVAHQVTGADIGEPKDQIPRIGPSTRHNRHGAPYGHTKGATFMSERMDFENCSLFHPVYNNDYSSFCLK